MVFTIMSFKVLIIDKSGESTPPEDGPQVSDGDETPPGDQENSGQSGQAEVSGPEKIDPADAPFTATDSSYLNDALFIGDSRTVGLREYGRRRVLISLPTQE